MRISFQRILSILFLLLSFLFFLVDLSWGRVPVKKVFPGWTSYTSSGCIKDLVLDQGILWAAAGGVIEYNLEKGTRVKYLKEHGIASNNVLKIVLHDDTLWAATANGISCLHLEKNTWKSFYKTDGLPDDAVTAAAVDAANSADLSNEIAHNKVSEVIPDPGNNRLRRPGGRFLKKLPPWTPCKNFLLGD